MKTLFLIVLLIAPITTSFEAVNNTTLTVLEEKIHPDDYERVILETLWKNGVSIDLSYIILAQAKHETGNFRSFIFRNTNNLFGMKLSKKRKTTAIGSFRSYAKYKNIRFSVMDYIHYMERRNITKHETSVYNYTLLLKDKKYFEDSTNRYYNGVLYYKRKMYTK